MPFIKKHKRILSGRSLVAVFCAALYWTLYCAFSVDTLFFNGISWKFRFLFLCVLLITALFLAEWAERVFVRRDTRWRKITRSVLLQTCLMLAFFLIVWPGSWSWDDISVLEYAKDYRFHGFQHFLTSLYMILCLYFIPSAAGATAMQAIVISVISGWTIAKVEQNYFTDITLPGRLLLHLAFYLPPMLFHNYLFFRNVMCAYIELALLVYAASVYRRELQMRDLLIFSAATVILSSWRSENIYYLPFFLLYLLFAGKSQTVSFSAALPGSEQNMQSGYSQKHSNRARLSARLLLWLVVCGLVFAIGKYNNHVIGTNNYSVLTSACPGLALYREALKDPERNADEISAIEKVLNKEVMEANPESGGAELYWATADFINSYTDEEYKEYLSSIFRLILRYPGTFFKERWKIFQDSLGVNDEQVMYVKDAILLFRENSGFKELSGYSGVTDEVPLLPALRERFLLFIGNLHEDLSFTPAHYIVWNLIPPMLILIAGFTGFIVAKKYIEAVCLFALLCKIPVLFLTAPACFFMYYISIYLIGYFLLFTATVSRFQSGRMLRWK